MQGQTQAQTNDCVKTTYDRQREHQEIILCGYAGLEGTLRIVDAAREELETRFVPRISGTDGGFDESAHKAAADRRSVCAG